MKKVFYLALMLVAAPMAVAAQDDVPQRQEQPQEQPPMGGGRPSTYDQADAVRKEFGLTDKQFSKVYDAYSKYNKAVFGEEFSQASGTSQQGQRPQGAPGTGGMRRGMGGPGGGMGGGPQGMPQGDFSEMQGEQQQRPARQRPTEQKPLTDKEIAKREKTMEKQEQKLMKSMRKILGTEDLYNSWLAMRQKQMPPMPERH